MSNTTPPKSIQDLVEVKSYDKVSELIKKRMCELENKRKPLVEEAEAAPCNRARNEEINELEARLDELCKLLGGKRRGG